LLFRALENVLVVVAGALGDGLGDGLGEGEGDGEGDGDGEADGDGLGEGLTDGDGEGDTDGVGLGAGAPSAIRAASTSTRPYWTELPMFTTPASMACSTCVFVAVGA
jgi:hypothetical protein